MIKFIISSFFIFMQKYNKNNLQVNSIKYKTISDENLTEDIFNNNYTRGYDQRYKIFYIDNEFELLKEIEYERDYYKQYFIHLCIYKIDQSTRLHA